MQAELTRYAELLIRHGLNLQPGQVLNISAECCHQDIVLLITQAAYKAGAKSVEVEFSDPRLQQARLTLGEEAAAQFVPSYLTEKYTDLVDSKAANLKLVGSAYPDIFNEVSPQRMNLARVSRYKAVKYFYDEGIGKSKVHWTVAAAATPAWGQKIFPELDPQAAETRLWGELLKVARADQTDCLELWKQHNQKLHQRAAKLNTLQIKTLHFTGPGTDLKVGLSPLALFKGGSEAGPYGAHFEPNIPTEEVFTTPDYRATEGTVKTTRPFLINGVLIKDLELTFSAGKISAFQASHGQETFAEYIKSDPGAERLGEVALVGIDSPIFKSGVVFQEILLDENAACHIAVGSAYKFCLKDGPTMTQAQLEEIGCNESSAHTDMMISNEHTQVEATTYSGDSFLLIKDGEWTSGY